MLPLTSQKDNLRVLVTGARGMLGAAVAEELKTRGHEPVPLPREEFDISDPMSPARLIAGEYGTIDAVINCAAYTAVDKAESEEREAFEANSMGPAYLGRACMVLSTPLIHLSTDFVFDGTSEQPYAEEDKTNPLSVYGRSKLEGERALAANPVARVVRTAWLYGQGKCFPKTMVEAHRAGKSLRVVADQRGNPTYVPGLARTLVDILEANVPPGVYHAVGPETTTWHDFATRAIQAATGETPNITPVATSEYPTPAVRPKNSALADTKLSLFGIQPMRPLDEALTDWASKLA